jgi:autotransporter-associated beta strand protein
VSFHRIPSFFTVVALVFFRTAALGIVAVYGAESSYAAAIIWNNTGTDFNTAGNWTGGVPSNNSTVTFDSAKGTNPNLSASLIVKNLDFSVAGASGYDLTSSNTTVKLTLLSVTATAAASAIRSVTTSGTNTIDAPIVLGAVANNTQTFSQIAGGTLVLNGVVSSTNANVGLSFAGGGTIQLDGANTYSGANSIDAVGETLVLGNDSALGTGSLTVNSAATLQAGGGTHSISNALALAANMTVSGANNLTLSGVVSGASTFTLTKAGSGTLTLSGTNTYSGATTINGGTVAVNSGSALGASGVAATINAGTLEAVATFSSARNYILGDVASTIMVDPAQTFTIGNVVSGTGGLTKTGTGTLTLSGTNTYSGATAINGGAIAVKSASSLGTTGGLTINAGTLEISTGYSTTRSITLGNAASTFQVDPSQTFTDTTAIGGSGSLNKTGAGTMVLGATETYTGSTNVSAGTLQIDASNRIVDTSALTVSGGTFDVQTFSETVAAVNLVSGSITGAGTGTLTGSSYAVQSGTISAILAGAGALTKTTSGTVTLSGANTYTGTTTVGSSGGADGGTLKLSGSGTISNATTTVDGGTLDLNGSTQSINNLALGGGASGSTAIVTIGAGNLNLGNNITYSATNNPNGATISGVGGGKLNLLGNRDVTVNDSTAAAADLTISAIIADGDATARQLTKSGGGTLVLTGINTYTGPTQVGNSGADNATAGTLQLSGSGKISNATATVVAGTLDLNSTTQSITNLNVSAGSSLAGSTATVNIGSGGVLNLGGNVVYAGGASLGAGVGTISAGTLNLNGTRTFTVDDSTAVATDMVVSSVIANGTTGSGLTKAGAGTMVLSGTNTFTGSTTINAGTLTAAATSGSALGSTSGITVNFGGTLLLGANDQINNSATMSLGGGTFAKGNFSEGTAGSAGTSTLGLGALTLTATGSTIDFGTGTVGALSFASLNAATFTLTISNWTGTANTIGNASTDRLIFNSDQTSNLSSFNFTGFGPGAVEFALGGGFFEVDPVPEPSTWCAAALAAVVIGSQLRHRIRTANRRKRL